MSLREMANLMAVTAIAETAIAEMAILSVYDRKVGV